MGRTVLLRGAARRHHHFALFTLQVGKYEVQVAIKHLRVLSQLTACPLLLKEYIISISCNRTRKIQTSFPPYSVKFSNGNFYRKEDSEVTYLSVMSPFLSFSFRLHGATSLLQRFLLPLVAAVALASYPSYKLRVHVRAKAGEGGGGWYHIYVICSHLSASRSR